MLLISSPVSFWTSVQKRVDPLDSPTVPFSPWTAAVVVSRSPRRCLCRGDTSWPEPACRSESWCRPSSWCSWCSGFYWTCRREGRGKGGLKSGIQLIFHIYYHYLITKNRQYRRISTHDHQKPWLRPCFSVAMHTLTKRWCCCIVWQEKKNPASFWDYLKLKWSFPAHWPWFNTYIMRRRLYVVK